MKMSRLLAIAAVTAGAVALLFPAAAGSQGGHSVVRIPFPREDGSLTPYTFRLGYPLVSLVYDTLMLRDEGGTPRPWLARSVRRDGLRVTVRLRRGVRWQDGRPLTSEDVVFTFGHVATRRHPRFTPEVRDVERVQAAGPDAVVITLRRPSLGFLDQPLADMPILPAHLWRDLPPDRLAPRGQPVGSGPYRLVEHRRGRSYRFEANRRYFRGAPPVDEIQVPIIRRASRTFQALRARRVDAIPVSLPEGSSRGLEGLGLRIADGTSFLGTALMFNLRVPPLNRREIRRAIAQAIDVERVARALGGGARAEDAQPVPAEHGYIHPGSSWATSADLHRFDPDAARIAVAELAIPPLTILVPRDDPVREEIGRQVVLALGRVGAVARTFKLSPEQLARAVGQDGAPSRFAVAIWNIEPLASYDPAFLRATFGDPTAPLNYSGYRSARFRRLADRVAAADTVRGRRRAVAAQLRLLARDLPVVPLVFPPGVYAFRPAAYSGWRYVQGTGIIDKRSFVDTESASAAADEAPATPIGDPVDREGGEGPPLLPFVLGAAGLLALVAATRLLMGSRAGRR